MKITSETKLFLGIIGATLVIVIAALFAFSKPAAPARSYARDELIPVGTTVTGSASASAYLVEFSDYQCPACKAWEPTVTEIISAYGDRMQFAYRHFPLDQHQVADTAARAAEAAGLQGKFWEMHSLLFGNQERMSDTIFAELAAQLSLDNDRFQNDMNSAAVREKIGRDRGDGIKFGVDSTPSFYLNGRKLELKEFDDLKKAVSQAVK